MSNLSDKSQGGASSEGKQSTGSGIGSDISNERVAPEVQSAENAHDLASMELSMIASPDEQQKILADFKKAIEAGKPVDSFQEAPALPDVPASNQSMVKSASKVRRDIPGLSDDQIKDLAKKGITVIEPIGSGGMASVYRVQDEKFLGEDESFDKSIHALKVMNSKASAKSIVRFQREIDALVLCDHPGVTSISSRHVGEFRNGTPYYTMSMMSGGSLHEKLADIDADQNLQARAIEGMVGVLDALEYLHSEVGYIHRDVKPANLLLSACNRSSDNPLELQLADLGIVKTLPKSPESEVSTPDDRTSGSADLQLTAMGAVGTPLYASPEQLLGEPVDARSDQYAAGTVLYRIATGEHVRKGMNQDQIFANAEIGEVPDPQRVNPEVSPELRDTIMKLLAKDPEDRFATAADAARALERSLVSKTEE